MPTYRAVEAEHFSTRSSDGVRVIYDRRTGQTHVLAPDAAAILDTLSSCSGSPDEIFAAMSRAHDLVADDGDALGCISERLSELASMALVDELH